MKNSFQRIALMGLLVAVLVSCSTEQQESATLFTSIDSSASNIDFVNKLEPTSDFNIYTYRNYYNGGGVAIGDVNNDSIPDIYFTSNEGDNKLYLNRGDFSFEDITETANVKGTQAWSTGVTMVDINADGWLDIYVCNSGDVGGDLKQNELFINQKDNTFIEAAEEWGIADKGYSTHAAFFDFDRDGDLDVYLLNNSYRAIGSFNLQESERDTRDPEGGDKLFRNDGGRFTDISEAAGIYGSVIGFGLGVTVGDVNKDSWPDIYVSNDFFERDYLYINNHDGTFTENSKERMKSMSVASMGADMADINNDAMPDIFVTEMLPNDNQRLKTKTTFEDWNKYQFNLKNDYYHQFTRNMLHVNRGDGSYAEIGRFAGVEATDWSWGALIEDFDNDGLKDLFISNGIAQDLTDQDFLNFLSNEETIKSMIEDGKVNYKKLIDVIPSEKVINFFYKNTNGYEFEDFTEEAGMTVPSFSNGSAYGDLDMDGDLDLIVNNVNMAPFVYRNESSNNHIQLKLKGDKGNTYAIGTKVYAYSDGVVRYQEFMPMKGFQSSMDYLIHFGLGASDVDSLVIDWYNGNRQVIQNPEINKRHYITIGEGSVPNMPTLALEPSLLQDITKSVGMSYTHQENSFSDFNNDRLLFHMNSTEGPCMEVFDANGDGLDDVIIGGSKDSPTSLFIQSRTGKFLQPRSFDFSLKGEDQDFEILDFDGDGDMDIYIARGGTEFASMSSDIIDKVWINDGKANFTEINAGLQANLFSSTAAVDAADIDGDGDTDIAIAERFKAGQYGIPVSVTLSINDGNGKYTNQTETLAPDMLQHGMFTDVEWSDVNGDGRLDLITSGHYLGIDIWINEGSTFMNATASMGLDSMNGWWNTIKLADIDNDGDMDIIAGNHGLNSRMRASKEYPMYLNVGDFDQNGRMDQIICSYVDGKLIPMPLKHDLEKQLPSLRKKYLKYKTFANESFEDIFSEEQRKNMISLPLQEMRSVVLLNNGNSFDILPLPDEAQYAPVYAIHLQDLDGDGLQDLFLGGNLYEAKPEVGRYDASQGLVLKNIGKGQFESLTSSASGVKVDGQIRDIKSIKIKGKDCIIVARNNESPFIYQLR